MVSILAVGLSVIAIAVLIWGRLYDQKTERIKRQNNLNWSEMNKTSEAYAEKLVKRRYIITSETIRRQNDLIYVDEQGYICLQQRPDLDVRPEPKIDISFMTDFLDEI